MKKEIYKAIRFSLTIILISLCMILTGLASEISKEYGDFTQGGFFWFKDSWDLSACDLELSYKVDMSNYIPAQQQTKWLAVGLRSYLNPLGNGWMSSGAPMAYETNPNMLDLDDKHNLGRQPQKGSWDEREYDALDQNTIVNPFGNYNNYGIWFDRDGVDPWQVNLWGAVNGSTYNTKGVYNIIINYHAINGGVSTMFSTVNGIATGFYTNGWKNQQPEIYPAGMSFTANMTRLNVWANIPVVEMKVYNLTATGCLVNAKNFKQDVLTSLKIIDVDNETNKTTHIFEKAAKHLEKSLDSELWEDESTLTRKGEKVFEEEKKTVHELIKVENSTFVSNAINILVKVDESLSMDAINEGISKNCSDKDIEKAENDILPALKGRGI